MHAKTRAIVSQLSDEARDAIVTQIHPSNHFTADTSAIAKIPKFRRLKQALKGDRNVSSNDPSSVDLGSSHEPTDSSASPGRDTFTQNGTTYAEDQLLYLVNEVKDFQIAQGSLLKPVDHDADNVAQGRGIGISILPTAFSKRCFDEAIALQVACNRLYISMSSDPEWLQSIYEPLLEQDAFLSTLWGIYCKVRDADALQPIACGIFRSDYMLHQPDPNTPVELRQVEMNTFSCAGACHAERAANMHRRLSHVRGTAQGDPRAQPGTLPDNQNGLGLVQALKAAHEAYQSSTERDTCVLMTVQPFNVNIADERPIEYGLWDAGVPCYRCEWQTILEHTTLTNDRTLLFRPAFGNGALEVSTVYYRSGYDAAEYHGQSWHTRLRLEMSRAIKCPDILTHLTTFKVVQAALTQPGVLERFLPDAEDSVAAAAISKLRATFMPIQTLDRSPTGMQARGLLTDPAAAAQHVLKPNLEGGGHNVYGAGIPPLLASLPQERWPMYTLMRLIEPPPATGTLMPPGDLHHGDVVSELGVLGACLWRRRGGGGGGGSSGVEVLRNEAVGWTFKTKPVDVEEMSVVKGFGCFDSPYLV